MYFLYLNEVLLVSKDVFLNYISFFQNLYDVFCIHTCEDTLLFLFNDDDGQVYLGETFDDDLILSYTCTL